MNLKFSMLFFVFIAISLSISTVECDVLGRSFVRRSAQSQEYNNGGHGGDDSCEPSTTEPPTCETTTEPPTTEPPTCETTTEAPTTEPPTCETTTETPTTEPPTCETTTEPPACETTTEPPTTESCTDY